MSSEYIHESVGGPASANSKGLSGGTARRKATLKAVSVWSASPSGSPMVRTVARNRGIATRGGARVSPEDSPQPVGGNFKRAMDIVVSSVAIVLMLPLLIIICLAIKLGMGGPIVYAHKRVGFGGREFWCLKFRTMVSNSEEVLKNEISRNPQLAQEWKDMRKLTCDPRVTTLGRVLRASSLDELPQLLNILRGDMSCVGPRPIVSEELERYGDKAGSYLAARPGLTGLWQVSGRSSLSYDERVRLDARYVNEWTLAQDLAILLRTVPALLRFEQTS